MSIQKVIEMVTAVLATIASFVAAAEDIFEGGQRGAEKKSWVVDQVAKLLAEKVHPFWGKDLGKTIISILIDVIVGALNKQGNLSASPASSAK